jgi:hypothetical protein
MYCSALFFNQFGTGALLDVLLVLCSMLISRVRPTAAIVEETLNHGLRIVRGGRRRSPCRA